MMLEAERAWGSKSQSSVDSSPRSYLFTSATVRIPFHTTLKRCTEHFTLARSAQLSSVTEIAPKKPFLSVSRSPIRYDFRASPRTIRYIVNIDLAFSVLEISLVCLTLLSSFSSFHMLIALHSKMNFTFSAVTYAHLR